MGTQAEVNYPCTCFQNRIIAINLSLGSNKSRKKLDKGSKKIQCFYVSWVGVCVCVCWQQTADNSTAVTMTIAFCFLLLSHHIYTAISNEKQQEKGVDSTSGILIIKILIWKEGNQCKSHLIIQMQSVPIRGPELEIIFGYKKQIFST